MSPALDVLGLDRARARMGACALQAMRACTSMRSRQASEALGHLTSRAAHSATQKKTKEAILAQGKSSTSPTP
eukprot:462330-Alexandrium_andersonii.AAC.1